MHIIITIVMSCIEVLTLPSPFKEPCPQGEDIVVVACEVAPK